MYMGRDKFENEELIKFSFPEDIWYCSSSLSSFLAFCLMYGRFHVDDVSSAHVYLRLKKGQTLDEIPPAVLEDCAQLVKANSIQGSQTVSSVGPI